MYCKHCGKEIDNLPFCPECGTPAGTAQDVQPVQDMSNDIAVVGFILSFFIGIAGLICSIIGLKRSVKCNGNGRGLSIAGIVIGSINIAVVIAFVMFYILAILGLLAIAAAWGAGAG